MIMDKIIVIFKTHLDLGFTNFARTVKERYMKEYIPNAMRTAREMRGEKERFIWTTGSWLIEQYLEEGEHPEWMEDAIRHGEIRWHALPFTTHTELMNPELFRYGLNISRKLDERFGMSTAAAKMTDVPGHTRSMIPLLAGAGVRFLHIGVNPASTRPRVPDLFRWETESGESVVVMYNGNYGELTEIGESGTAVYFAHTGDNRGPQSAEEIRKVYRKLHERFPEAELVAGTLEDVVEAVEQAVKSGRIELPVVTQEIGDTWIHGTASDPGKVSQYRALLRLKDVLSEEDMEKMYRHLILIPEHTWGLDEKMWLGRQLENGELEGEHRYFKKEEFLAEKASEKFRNMELSWKEQRGYVKDAVNSLSGESLERAQRAVGEYKRPLTDLDGYEKKETGQLIEIGGYKVSVGKDGEIDGLSRDGRVFADKEHRLGSFVYEVFSEKEYSRFRDQYVISGESWALEDFGKIGAGEAVDSFRQYRPERSEVWVKGNELVIRMKLPEEAVRLYGGMKEAELKAVFGENGVSFDFAWEGKQESRVPEAAWLGFCPLDEVIWIQKMGGKIRPDDVISGGGRRIHAVEEKIAMKQLTFRTEDAPVISLERPGLLDFTDEIPKTDRGFWVNLCNNVWGTNFTMWYGEDARFRVEMEIEIEEER